MRSRNQASESTQLREDIVSISQLRLKIEFSFSQVRCCVHYVEIHQLRRLVFDDYQRCPVSLEFNGFIRTLYIICSRETLLVS